MRRISGRTNFNHIWLFICIFFIFSNILLLTFIISVSQKFRIVNTERDYLAKQISISKDTLGNIDKLVLNNEIFAEKTLKSEVEAKDLFSLEKSFWSYNLVLNGYKVTSNEISVKPGKVTLVFTENEKQRVLPLSMHVIGSITYGDEKDNYYDHVIFKDKSLITISHVGDDTLNRTTTYEFNINSGEQFTVTLTEILAERLGLSSKYIVLKA